MTDVEAVEIVNMLVAMYPSPGWPKERVKLYAAVIADLDRDLTRAGVLEVFRTRTEDRAPMPADLRRLVAAKQATAMDSPYLEPDEAWGHVVENFTRIGGYRPFPTTNALVAEVVRSIGWETLCRSGNPEADRAHFLQLYRQRLERARRGDAATPGAEPRQARGEPARQVSQRPDKPPAVRADAHKLLTDVRAQAERRAMPTSAPEPADLAPVIVDAEAVASRDARRQALLDQAATLRGAP